MTTGYFNKMNTKIDDIMNLHSQNNNNNWGFGMENNNSIRFGSGQEGINMSSSRTKKSSFFLDDYAIVLLWILVGITIGIIICQITKTHEKEKKSDK